jgi:hypothetical protein
MPLKLSAIITSDDVRILKDNNLDEEVLYWNREEWEEDPSIVPSILNAIIMAYENPQQLLDKIGKTI